jgi:hypothetical protein
MLEMDETAGTAGVGGPLVVADNENISSSSGGSSEKGGWWRQCLFVRNGRRVPANWPTARTSANASRWPVATALFERLLAPLDGHDGASASASSSSGVGPSVWAGGGAGVSERLPKGSIEYSMLGPGAHLKPHCGPSNHRLRIHLPIILPTTSQENEQIRMIVAGAGSTPGPTATDSGAAASAAAGGSQGGAFGGSRAWVAGRATIFDDSYEVHHRPLCDHTSAQSSQHSTTQDYAELPACLRVCVPACVLIGAG